MRYSFQYMATKKKLKQQISIDDVPFDQLWDDSVPGGETESDLEPLSEKQIRQAVVFSDRLDHRNDH